MARRTPFAFRDHLTGDTLPALIAEKIDGWITRYEDALAVEYSSGDIEIASYHEGLRTAYEEVLVDTLGIDHDLINDYWKN